MNQPSSFANLRERPLNNVRFDLLKSRPVEHVVILGQHRSRNAHLEFSAEAEQQRERFLPAGSDKC